MLIPIFRVVTRHLLVLCGAVTLLAPCVIANRAAGLPSAESRFQTDASQLLLGTMRKDADGDECIERGWEF